MWNNLNWEEHSYSRWYLIINYWYNFCVCTTWARMYFNVFIFKIYIFLVLQIALAGAPPSSDIFVFTDATAKDSELGSIVQAMIERTKSTVSVCRSHLQYGISTQIKVLFNSVFPSAFLLIIQVTFMLTGSFSYRRRRAVSQSQQFTSRSLFQSDIQLYRDLAHVSGGQTIEVPKRTLSQATAVITDSSTSALVYSNNDLKKIKQ